MSKNVFRAEEAAEPFFLYRLTNYYYTVIGFLLVFSVAIPVSLLTRDVKEEVNLNPDTIVSYCQRFMTEDKESNKRQANGKEKEYYTIDQALNILNIGSADSCDKDKLKTYATKGDV